jgi:hypothetical protein
VDGLFTSRIGIEYLGYIGNTYLAEFPDRFLVYESELSNSASIARVPPIDTVRALRIELVVAS